MIPQPAGPATPTGAPPTAEKPGAAGIWIGIGLILLGVIGGIALIVAGARSLVHGVDGLERVPSAAGGTIQLDEAGTVKVYAERDVARSAPESFSSSTTSGPVPDVELSILDPDGRPVVIRPVPGSESYQGDGHWGTRIGRFDVEQPGTYTVEVVGGDGLDRYDTIAVGDSISLGGVRLILAGILGGGLLVLLGTVVVIVAAVKRSKAKKRIAQARSPYPGGGSGGPQPGWPAAAGPYPPPGWAPPPGPPHP